MRGCWIMDSSICEDKGPFVSSYLKTDHGIVSGNKLVLTFRGCGKKIAFYYSVFAIAAVT